MKRKTKILNTAEIKFPSLSQNESLARAFTSAFLMQLNPTIEEISDLKCAVSEAVTNSIVHGYVDKTGDIKLRYTVQDNDVVVIDVIDKGCGIDDIIKAEEPLFTTNTDGERSGMGFTVMKAFTDKMKVYSKPGKGTRVRLVKTLVRDDT